MPTDHNVSELGKRSLNNARVFKPHLHQMTSVHNRLRTRKEFKNTTGTNEQSSLKLAGSKSCSLSKQDSYITTRVGITIPPSHSNAEDNSVELQVDDQSLWSYNRLRDFM
ncbi:hypothetical protein Tco_0079359 [Tanacetum coccineum]